MSRTAPASETGHHGGAPPPDSDAPADEMLGATEPGAGPTQTDRIPEGMPRPGDVVGDGYRVVELIAVGGQGAVYRVHEEGLEREAALKVLLPALRDDDLRCYQFSREARTLSRVADPGLVQIYRVGKDRRFGPFIVMELLRGATLREVLELSRDRRLRLRDALRIMLETGETLDVLIRQGIVHRDLKPENIFLSKVRRRSKDGHKDDLVVKILDLGAAFDARDRRSPTQIDGKGRVVTPAYMSPEQIRSRPITQASDQYSLAVLIYECIAGEQIFVRHHAGPVEYQHWVMWHLGGEPEPLHVVRPDVPEYVWPLFARALSKEPEKRFASFPELCAAIRALLRRVLEDGTHVERNQELNEYLTTVLEEERSGERAVRKGTDVMTYPDDHSRRAAGPIDADPAGADGERASAAPSRVPELPDEQQEEEPGRAAHSAPGVASVTAPSAAIAPAASITAPSAILPPASPVLAPPPAPRLSEAELAALARRVRLRVVKSCDELLRPEMTIAPFESGVRTAWIHDVDSPPEGVDEGTALLAIDDRDTGEGVRLQLTPEGTLVVARAAPTVLVGAGGLAVKEEPCPLEPQAELRLGLTWFVFELDEAPPRADLHRLALIRASLREALDAHLPATLALEVVASGDRCLRGTPLRPGEHLSKTLSRGARAMSLAVDPNHRLVAEIHPKAGGRARVISYELGNPVICGDRSGYFITVEDGEIFAIGDLSLRLLPLEPIGERAAPPSPLTAPSSPSTSPSPEPGAGAAESESAAPPRQRGGAGRSRATTTPAGEVQSEMAAATRRDLGVPRRLALAALVGVAAAVLLAIGMHIARDGDLAPERSATPSSHAPVPPPASAAPVEPEAPPMEPATTTAPVGPPPASPAPPASIAPRPPPPNDETATSATPRPRPPAPPPSARPRDIFDGVLP